MSLPALRFKEFNGEWVAKKLSDVASRIGDGLHSTPVYDESGDYYFVNGNNLTNNKIEINESTKRLNNSEYLKHKVELSSKSILMSINGTIGNLAFFNNEPVVLGKSACYINLKADENKHFVFNLLQTSNIKSYFDKELTGSTIKNLSLTTIKNTSAYFPCHEEQTKIANFITAVDEKITQLTQKHDLLTQYKKGVMQQIFSQELRFKDDDGRDFPEWGGTTLGEVCKPQQWQTISAAELTETGFPAYGANGQIGFYSEYNHEFETVAVTCRGATCGEVNLIPAKSYITGNSMCLDEINCKDNNHRFIYYALKLRGFRDVISGSAQPQIVGSSIRKVNFLKPGLKEQTKIANFLTSIDDKINATQAQLDAVKQYKQGLLQQMFV